MAKTVNHLPEMQETQVPSLGQEDTLERETAIHSSTHNPLQYFCLESSMDRGAWWARIHGVKRVRPDWATSWPSFYLSEGHCGLTQLWFWFAFCPHTEQCPHCAYTCQCESWWSSLQKWQFIHVMLIFRVHWRFSTALTLLCKLKSQKIYSNPTIYFLFILC